MPKISFIGGGSQKFVRASVIDLLGFEELHDSHIVLMDINRERLSQTEGVLKRMFGEQNAPTTVESTIDQRRALDGADYVINTIMVGGMKHYESDTFIPAKYGVFEAAGDTIGPGAVFRLLRTAPVLEKMVNNLRELSPNAWLLSYVNPMAMVTQALIEYGHQRTVGLCHAVQGCYREIAKWLGIPPEEITCEVAGINHLNFYLRLEHKGKNLYPELLANADRIVKEAESWEVDEGRVRRGYERVRFDILKYLGYFPVEGPWHQGEYYPWFRKTAELVNHYGPVTGWAYDFDRKLAVRADKEAPGYLNGDTPIDYTPSIEFGIPIIHSIETNTARKVYGNVYNRNTIGNLPSRSVVEVPCTVDRTGVRPRAVEQIPTQLAGIMHQHITVHQLALDGVRQKDRTLIRQAVQADPLTGAALSLPKIEEMVDELFEENRAYLEDWQ